MPLAQQFLAELIGTFWLIFGGCGSAVLAAFPNVGIGLHGVPLAFSLVLRTSDSLLKMDIRAAHEWRRLKAACL